MLKTFGRSVPTTWNLNQQCVDPFEVTDDALQRVLNILEMPGRRKNCQADKGKVVNNLVSISLYLFCIFLFIVIVLSLFWFFRSNWEEYERTELK